MRVVKLVQGVALPVPAAGLQGGGRQVRPRRRHPRAGRQGRRHRPRRGLGRAVDEEVSRAATPPRSRRTRARSWTRCCAPASPAPVELVLAGGSNLATRLIERVVPTGDLLTPRRDETPKDVVVRVGRALAGEVLAVQGPPGTGKTYAGSALIRELLDAGLRVGVTAQSHAVVLNLLDEVARPAWHKDGTNVEEGDEPDDPNALIRHTSDNAAIAAALASGEATPRRGHRLALVARRHGRRGRRARHRRGGPVLARQRGGRRPGRALARPARRPPAADPADQGGPPVRLRRVGPRPPAHHGRRPASTTSSPPTGASSSTARTACTRV